MKTLQLSGIQRCQIFNQLKRCASKNAVPMLIERTPPPGGGFLFTMFPNQKPRGSGYMRDDIGFEFTCQMKLVQRGGGLGSSTIFKKI